MRELTRRGLLTGSALAAAALAGAPAHASAPLASTQGPGVYRYRIGSYQLTALYDGTWYRKIDDKFVRNASAARIDRALAASFLPPRVIPTPFTPLLVNTGTKLILIDAGTAGQLAPTTGQLAENLGAAGIDAAAIDTILISHFHPDHINGIKDKDGRKVFPNAEILVPEPEWKFWMDDSRMQAAPDAMRPMFLNARRIFAGLAKEVRRFAPGGTLAASIASIAAFGHTPGHTAFAVSSGGQSVLVLGDTVNHPWLFARHPEWQAVFDMDGKRAVATRRRLLDRAAADRMLVHGYHFPFPAAGYIVKSGRGYDFVPVMWQPL